jgi:two-component system sensor histidine kinase UhpB
VSTSHTAVLRVPLLWRVFAANAGVLVLAMLVLAVSPATVSFPLAVTEAVILVMGLGAMLLIDLMALRRAFAPLRRLTAFVRGVDPLRPGSRAPDCATDPDVAELTHAVNEMLETLEAERRESGRRALAAQEGERARIARELHDEIGQRLTAVMLQLGGAGASVGEHVSQAREDVRAALEDVREIARRLRPEALDDLGLPAALAALTGQVARRADLDIERRIGSVRALDPEEELVVYRVTQEALTNVARHARARAVTVRLETRGDRPVLTVLDDGRGFDVQAVSDGAGLRGMRERSMLVNGRLEVASRVGAGSEITLWLP